MAKSILVGKKPTNYEVKISKNLISKKDIIPLIKNSNRFLKHMQQDKKNVGGNITLIMVNSIGDAFIERAASKASLLEYLSEVSGQKNA